MESKWGAEVDRVTVTCNLQQAEATRDALAKGLYTRLFDHLVKVSITFFIKTDNKYWLKIGIWQAKNCKKCLDLKTKLFKITWSNIEKK